MFTEETNQGIRKTPIDKKVALAKTEHTKNPRIERMKKIRNVAITIILLGLSYYTIQDASKRYPYNNTLAIIADNTKTISIYDSTKNKDNPIPVDYINNALEKSGSAGIYTAEPNPKVEKLVLSTMESLRISNDWLPQVPIYFFKPSGKSRTTAYSNKMSVYILFADNIYTEDSLGIEARIRVEQILAHELSHHMIYSYSKIFMNRALSRMEEIYGPMPEGKLPQDRVLTSTRRRFKTAPTQEYTTPLYSQTYYGEQLAELMAILLLDDSRANYAIEYMNFDPLTKQVADHVIGLAFEIFELNGEPGKLRNRWEALITQ